MDLMQKMNINKTEKITNLNITIEGIELLTKLSEFTGLEEVKHIRIKTNSMDCINYSCPDDISTIDLC